MMTSGSDVERTLMRLRTLWKSLLSKNEKSLFMERKLCRNSDVSPTSPAFATSRPRKKWRKDNDLAGGDASQVPQVSLSCQVQNLDPKKYNFNILRISTPNTTDYVQELDETFESENLSIISPTLITTPGESEEFSVPRSSPYQSEMSTSCKSKNSSNEEPSKQNSKDLIKFSEKTFDNKVHRGRCSNFSKDKICKASKSNKPEDNQRSDQSKRRNSSRETLCTSSTLKSGSMSQPFKSIPTPSPDKVLLSARSNRLICDVISMVNSSHQSGKAKQLFIGQDLTPSKPEVEMLSPALDKFPFNPVYYKLTDISTKIEGGDSLVKKVVSTPHQFANSSPDQHLLPERSNRHTEKKICDTTNKKKSSQRNNKPNCMLTNVSSRTEENNTSLVKTAHVAPDEDIREKVDQLVVFDGDESMVECHNCNGKDHSTEIIGAKDVCEIGPSKRSVDSESSKNSSVNKAPSTRPFLRKGRGRPAGKDIPEEHATKKGQQEANSKKEAASTNTKCAVAKDKRPSLPKQVPRVAIRHVKTTAEDAYPESTASDHEIPEDIPEIAPCIPDGYLSKCPWRRDLEYASKGATCRWAQAFEENVRRMRPFASAASAEQELRRALEDLDGKSWQSKEDALLTVVRCALHHPCAVGCECARVVSVVCGEVRNFQQSVAGKAVLTAGLLYHAMGKKMENKLRVVVGALLTKSGNRTLSAYFRLIIRSLFRIVDASSPHKVALAFVHEGSRHPNKATRETAAQFLVLLTETMGPGDSLSGPMTGPMLKCTAHFVHDCSPLTRYCGKRMFRVLMKHPNFEKLKDHHLDVGTAQNLIKVIESIATKGVDEELLPINIIK